MAPWSERLPGLAYGAGYHPESWPEGLWAQDVRLMAEAGVTLVTVGVSSWALLEPRPGVYEFGWLDRVLDLLHGAGIAVALGTATASPPPWLTLRHPEMLPMTSAGTTLWPGGRPAWCPSSPVYRARALALAQAMGNHFARHPALALWYVQHDVGGQGGRCYCDVSAAAFRRWLRRRYIDLHLVNEAWRTGSFYQHYTEWTEILPPRASPGAGNTTQQLDYARFSSDELLDCFRAERDALHQRSPGIPVTTGFRAGTARTMDYWSWANQVDVVANEHDLDLGPRGAGDGAGSASGTPGRRDGDEAHIWLSLSADLARGLGGGAPWLLTDHSTGAAGSAAPPGSPASPESQPRRAKVPGQLARNSLAHIARGSEGAVFSRWRGSPGGAEAHLGAMIPHAGTDSGTWREVTALGALLGAATSAGLRGSTVHAKVALFFDWQAWWALELDGHRVTEVAYLDQVRAYYRALWLAGVSVDIVDPSDDLAGYRLVVVPNLYIAEDTVAPALERHVRGGGSLLVTYLSGIVDVVDQVLPGPHPGALRDLLGVRGEGFSPLAAGEALALDDGTTATVWSEVLHLAGAEVLASYTQGPLAGTPALTRRVLEGGAAWYVATRLDTAATDALVAVLLTEAGVAPVVAAPPGLEAVRRRGGDGASFLFLLNHTAAPVEVAARGHDLVTGKDVAGVLTVPAGGVALVVEAAAGPA